MFKNRNHRGLRILLSVFGGLVCAIVIHVVWDVFFEFQVVFGCSVVVQVVFPFVHRVWGCVLRGVSRLGMFFSILFTVFRRVVCADSFHSWCMWGVL